MKTLRIFSWVVSVLGLAFWCATSQVLAAPSLGVPSGLSLAEIKITGNEFILLQNNTGSSIASTELSNYWVYGFNGPDPTAAGVSSSTQQLPAASLAAGQTLLLGDGGATCGAAATDNLSISLNDSTGFLEVVHVSFSGGTLTQTAGDSVSWNSSTNGGSSAAASITVPTNTTAKASYADYRFLNSSPAAYWWQPATVDSSNTCQLDVSAAPAVVNPGNQLTPSPPPPASVITATVSSGIPAGDVGLAAPQITELLPNPTGTGNDSTDEFIEIYNPNDTAFDLSGFTLETGLTTKHDFTFDDGSSIPPKTFAAFYSADTGLTLSNTGGQAWLLDPQGNIVSQSDSYATAKDGQSWSLANGVWYWTSSATPNLANQVVLASSTKAVTKGKTPTVAAVTSSLNTAGSNSLQPNSKSTTATPIHAWTLAVVGGAAILYATYEYRNDLQNNIYRLRKYRAARAASGATIVPAGIGRAFGGFGRWQNNLRSWLGQRFKK